MIIFPLWLVSGSLFGLPLHVIDSCIPDASLFIIATAVTALRGRSLARLLLFLFLFALLLLFVFLVFFVFLRLRLFALYLFRAVTCAAGGPA